MDMGYSVNIDDVEADEVSPGVFERVLLTPENTGRGPPGELTIRHYVIEPGSTLTLGRPGVEYQDFIINGTLRFGRRFLHGNTTIFVPSDREHTYRNMGEGEARVISHTYTVPEPSHRWCKTRVSQLTYPMGAEQLMTEEYHALTGAKRFHALDIQDFDIDEHTNPEETAYFMRGTGRMLSGDEWHDFRPGTLVYTEEGAKHAIRCDHPAQYFVIEYVEQDRMWSQRGYSGRA